MTVFVDDPDFTLYVGDVRESLLEMPDESVHCVVTSPPYWGLRDYGVDGQVGLEPTPDEYVARMVSVFREVRRVLRPDGTCWLNIGDSYSQGTKGNSGAVRPGDKQAKNTGSLATRRGSALGPNRTGGADVPAKDLIGIPWRVAFALQADGWHLRSDIIWFKMNPMPESVRDRPTKSHEYLFLLSKSSRYFYDVDAIREPHAPDGRKKLIHDHRTDNSHPNYDGVGDGRERWPNGGRNKRSVWAIATESYKDAHFATFPQALVEPCVMAGTSEHGCCSGCGTPWARDVDVSYDAEGRTTNGPRSTERAHIEYGLAGFERRLVKTVTTVGWYPLCTCGGADLRPIYSPIGEDGGYDPTPETGRAGLDRPRAVDAGRRRSTRYEQVEYAKQLKASPARPEMEEQAGDAFSHYVRTDSSGARPIPEMFLEWWIGRGWLTRVKVPSADTWPPVVPSVVLDPFMGSGTTALVARRFGRRAVGIELNPEYAKLATRRLQQLSLFADEAAA